MLAPLGESLGRVEAQVRTLERDRVEQFARLDASVGHVAAAGESLRAQTASLAGALRSSNARGAWGEVQLRRVVEHAGMLSRVDFDTQVSGIDPGRRRSCGPTWSCGCPAASSWSSTPRRR